MSDKSEVAESTVLLVGLDGVDPAILDRYGDDLETLTSLVDEGVYTDLASTFPPMTASAWPSIYTGVGPSYHGVYHFLNFKGRYPPDAEPVDRTDVDAPAIWNYLTACGLGSITFNVPMTSPADAVDGVVMPGLMAPHHVDGYPPGIRDELSDVVGADYEIYPDADTVESYLAAIKMREAASRYLLETFEWRFAFMQLQHTDSAFHYLEHEAEIRRVYRAADEYIAAVVEAVPEDTHIIVCSDHGIGRTIGQTIYLNEWLHREGYVNFGGVQDNRDSPGIMPEGIKWILRNAAGTVLKRGHQLVEGTPIETAILSMLPRTVVKDVTRRTVDWAGSRAFCRSGTELGIRLNVEGRDPAGIVPPEEYDAVRSEIRECLEALRTPDGEQAFEYVRFREDIYGGGPYLEDAPDIVFMPFTRGNTVSHECFGPTFRPKDSFEHRSTGVFVGRGPSFDGWDGESLALPDIAPLVFHLLDLPVPERMTGSVPEGVGGSPERAVYEDVAYRHGKSSTDEAIADRLADLGYL